MSRINCSLRGCNLPERRYQTTLNALQEPSSASVASDTLDQRHGTPFHHIFVQLLIQTPLNGTKIIFVYSVFLTVLLELLDKLYCGAIQITNCIVYCIILYCIVLHCTVQHCTVLYCLVLSCTVLHCTALHCTVLYCIVLYCIVSHRCVVSRVTTGDAGLVNHATDSLTQRSTSTN